MTEILTLTLNPALDLGAEVDHVIAGPKLRLGAPLTEPGGGGINVARAGAILGGKVRAIAALAGLTGDRMRGLLADAGFDLVVFPLPGETRQSLVVTDRGDGAQYRFMLPGPEWSAAEVAALLDLAQVEAAGVAVVVLSGSQPPGVPDDFPTRLIARLPGARVIIDTSGPALARLTHRPAPGARPHVLRMDQAEAEGQAGRPLRDVAATLDEAQAMVRRGVADCVVLARGAEGSVLATATQRLLGVPPKVRVVSKVGAGDSFTAAFALTLARGGDWAEALRHGTAAAAAAVMTPGSALCRAPDVARLLPLCRIDASL